MYISHFCLTKVIHIYLPKYKASLKMSNPIMATIIVANGRNAVMKTGPFFLITNV